MTDMRIFTCPSCAHQQADYFPRCPACGKWIEPDEAAVEEIDQQMHTVAPRTPATPATETQIEDPPRIPTGFDEADRVLGGGICEGSALLFTGAPGVGKSTLLMQLAARVATIHGPVLYVSAEESLPQAAARAKRIDARHADLYILADNGLEEAVHELRALHAALLIVDSLQLVRTKYCDNPPGSAAQVKEVSARLTELAKKSGTPILVAGQIIKSGKFAGPMSVPHLYDGVFHLDEMTLPGFVLLRVEKNRFGSKAEVGSFRMTARGVEEVPSPSAEILKGGGKGIIAVAMEGTKPIATEIQVGFLQRGDLSEAVVGYPKERLRLIQTILDGYGIEVPNTIALDVLGGYKISDSAADLAVAIATVHAVKSTPMPRGWGAIGEVALDGRLLPPQEFVSRYRELEVLGIENCIVPHCGSDSLPPSRRVKTFRAQTLREALRIIGFALPKESAGRPKETREGKAASVADASDDLEKESERARRNRAKGKPTTTPEVPEETENPPAPPPQEMPPAPHATRPPDPLIQRIAELAREHSEITPNLIRRQLGVGLRKAYQLHEKFVASQRAPHSPEPTE
jgi:DNA repair protein RadA/Sms